MVEGVSGEADTPFTFPASPVQGEHVPLTNFTCGRACAGNLKTMNATEMIWRVLANGQKVMGRECLEMAREAKTVEDVRQCVDLANKCALIETACLEMAKREAPSSVPSGYRVCQVCGLVRPHDSACPSCL